MSENASLFTSIVALIAALVMIGGCHPIERSELVGTWIITAESRTDLEPEFRSAEGRIDLRPDGTFAITEMPGDLFLTKGLVSGCGRWELIGGDGTRASRFFDLLWQGEETVQLNLRKITRGHGSPVGIQIYVYGAQGEGRMYYQLHPDLPPIIYLERSTNLSLPDGECEVSKQPAPGS